VTDLAKCNHENTKTRSGHEEEILFFVFLRGIVVSWSRFLESLKSDVGSLKIAAWPVLALVAVLMVAGLRPGSAAQTLDFYFIDVEGGQSTLIVTPAGESLLVDTGYGAAGGRDSTRILAAARAAGIKAIDYLLMTHFHPDHDGGVVELSRQMPIKTFFDHGDLVRSPEALAESRWPGTLAAYEA